MMLNKKRGRPTDNPKDYLLRVRMDVKTAQRLSKCASAMGVSKSQAVRLAISMLNESIQENEK